VASRKLPGVRLLRRDTCQRGPAAPDLEFAGSVRGIHGDPSRRSLARERFPFRPIFILLNPAFFFGLVHPRAAKCTSRITRVRGRRAIRSLIERGGRRGDKRPAIFALHLLHKRCTMTINRSRAYMSRSTADSPSFRFCSWQTES